MFPQFKKINNESGVVLFIVLMTAIIIMIFSVGILTQSMNEINFAQQQIDQITAKQLASGYFWNAYSQNAMTSGSFTTTLNNRVYTVSMASAVINGTASNWQTSVNYDTFQ
jgi:hypothetical protein